MQRKLLYILNEPTYFVSHRLPIARAAREAGYDIHVATGEPEALQEILDEGFTYHSIPLSRSGRNILKESYSVFAMYRLMRRLKPDIVHLVTIKPVIYGSLAARLSRTPAVVAAVSGLGYAFIDQHIEARILRMVVSKLYRQAFRHNNIKVIFQNRDDQRTLMHTGALIEEQSTLIHGSGVDLVQYCYAPEPETSPLIVVMASRLLRDKGVEEYVEACKILREKQVNATFLLAGRIDHGNPSAITEKKLKTWSKGGIITYIGYQKDTASLFSTAHLVVLPSYREGLPRVLSEAAACGRAIVTTDVPGCRAAIIPGETGLLAHVRDAHSLAEAMLILLNDNKLRENMGKAGRQFAERTFDVSKVITQHLEIYKGLIELTRVRVK